MLSHPFANFEIQNYYKDKPYFKWVYSRNDLPNILKDGLYVIKLEDHKSLKTCIGFYINGDDTT